MSWTVLDAAGARFGGYGEPDFNLLQRTALQPTLRASIEGLAQWPRERWQSHGNWHGLAAHWSGIHRAMRDNDAQVTRAFEDLAEGRVPAEQRVAAAGQARAAALQGLDHLHAHHRIEDGHLFPQLLRARPALQRPLALLEADHIVLEAAIGPYRRLLAQLPGMEAPAVAWEPLAEQARRLQAMLCRHLDDEEEIVMPAVLGVA